MRAGIGFDAHRFDANRPLILGGVTIPGSPGLAGHSDGDVLCHAIADALLGAARLGDLGTMFPNDERWRDASSLTLLEETVIALRGWTVANIDATVVAEQPRVAPHREAMIEGIAAALKVEPESVWIKATTTDGLGFTGRSEGIAALACALVASR